MSLLNKTREDSFRAKIDMNGGCWLWTGRLNRDEYGCFDIGKKNYLAHRISYMFFVKDVGTLQLHHLCEVKNCVNPSHLQPITITEHLKLQKSASKTHCVNGHEYTPENTYRGPRGWRQCRICVCSWAKKYQSKKRGERVAA